MACGPIVACVLQEWVSPLLVLLRVKIYANCIAKVTCIIHVFTHKHWLYSMYIVGAENRS